MKTQDPRARELAQSVGAALSRRGTCRRTLNSLLACLEETPQPFSAAQQHPGHLTASAWVFNPRVDAVLLVFHPKIGRWVQPGGHVEAEDSRLVATARREVLEEAGFDKLELVTEFFDVECYQVAAGTQKHHQHWDVRSLFRARQQTPSQPGSLPWRWQPLASTELTDTEPAPDAAPVPADPSVRACLPALRQASVDPQG